LFSDGAADFSGPGAVREWLAEVLRRLSSRQRRPA
jgi:hypothetical protein